MSSHSRILKAGDSVFFDTPCPPSAAVSLKSPRIEALFKGPNLCTGGSFLPIVCSILAAWEEEHTQAA